MLVDVAPLGLESVKTFIDWINLSKSSNSIHDDSAEVSIN